MSVRKRTWKNAKGERQESWIVDYVDQKGKRHIKTFQKKKAADAYHAAVRVFKSLLRYQNYAMRSGGYGFVAAFFMSSLFVVCT
jgi:hypothetical protein